MRASVCADPLPSGDHEVTFNGVRQDVGGTFNGPINIWEFANQFGVCRIVTGRNFGVSSSAAKLLAVLSGQPAKIGFECETDDYLGKAFIARIQVVAGKRSVEIVAKDGASVAIGNDE